MKYKSLVFLSLLPLVTSCRGVFVDKDKALSRLNGIKENVKKESFQLPVLFTREYESEFYDKSKNSQEIAFINNNSLYFQRIQSGNLYGETTTVWFYVEGDDFITAKKDSKGSVYKIDSNLDAASTFKGAIANYLSYETVDINRTPDDLLDIIGPEARESVEITYENYFSRGTGQLSADLRFTENDIKKNENYQFDGNKVTLIEKKVSEGTEDYASTKVSYEWNVAKWTKPDLSDFVLTSETIKL